MDLDDFYSSDERKYNLANNKQFLKWFYQIKKKGYPHDYSEIKEYQKLIDFITTWYEIKYPNRLFDYYKGIDDKRFSNYQCMTDNLKMEDLFYQLSNRCLSVLECNYHGHGFHQVPITDDQGNIIGKKKNIIFSIRQEIDGDVSIAAPSMYVSFDPENGILNNNFEYDEYFNDKGFVFDNIFSHENVSIRKLYNYLSKKYGDNLDLEELKSILFINDCDRNLRKYLLDLVALKIVYSENTKPEYGHIRAGKFIDEFNEYYIKEKNENLNLSINEIDEIINKYLSHKIKVKVK